MSTGSRTSADLGHSRRNWMVIAAAAVVGIPSVVVAQQTISCISYQGLTISGCTAFGYGDDNDIRDFAAMYIGAESHASTEFCNEVWTEAKSWVQGYLSGVYNQATLDGVDKDALGLYNGGSWSAGWLKAAWLRDQSLSKFTRASYLHDYALHEAAHKVCEMGDNATSCDPSDEDAIDNLIDDCRSQN